MVTEERESKGSKKGTTEEDEVTSSTPKVDAEKDSPRTARWVGLPYKWTRPEAPFCTCPMCVNATQLMKDCPQVRFWALMPASDEIL